VKAGSRVTLFMPGIITRWNSPGPRDTVARAASS
jgi:hypothetical protein